MKFTSLTLRNWRPFHGTHRIEFSVYPEKPVTLILGPNGAGKTALLNAFTWALYGDFTDGFRQPESLVNFEAIKADPSAETWVELMLEHESQEYRIRRVTDARRQAVREYQLTVTKNGERAVEDDIYRILPKPLKDLFFFPAETFGSASVLEGDRPGAGASLNIGTAIRSLLAGDIYDRAVDDLRRAMGSDALKPPQNYTDSTVEDARKSWEQAQAVLNAMEERQDQLPALLAQARDQATKAKNEAEKYNPEEIKKWELEYNRLKDQVGQAELAIQRANALYVNLARRSHMHFSQHVAEFAVSRLGIAEKFGLMPPRIHESVLNQALTDGRCSLCQSALTEQAQGRVKQLLDHVTETRVAVMGLETRTTLKQYLARGTREIADLRDQVVSLSADLAVPGPQHDADLRMIQSVLRMCIEVADRQLAKATREFKEFADSPEVGIPADGQSPVDIALIRQRAVDHLEAEAKDIPTRIAELSEAVRANLENYTKKSSKSDGYKRKTAAIEILREVKEFFDEARAGLNKFGREDFEKAINATYSDLIAKSFEIRVGDDFSITVASPGRDDSMPLSQSEKVLLLIAFLGAIARLAPHYEEIARNNLQLRSTGNVGTSQINGFPVVLDSPTSVLDTEYEAEVVKVLPNLLPQVVIIVSAKSVEAWETISPQIGSISIMELTSPRTSNRTVQWNGKDHTYSTQDDGVDPARTRITLIG
ncbi:AAA family ATPase [Nocardia vulneris]|uniref:AAA family ATPase n=1 Tax=Nocardia vulneris TaxID=1141657 RepID=UPI0030D27CE8